MGAEKIEVVSVLEQLRGAKEGLSEKAQRILKETAQKLERRRRATGSRGWVTSRLSRVAQ